MQKSTNRSTFSSFPKIKRLTTTAAGFITGKVSGLTNHKSNNEQNYLKEIEKKIDEQRKDLDERNIAIKSLLGHFEHIALVCRDEKNKNIEFREQNMELVREISQLKTLIEEKNQADSSRSVKHQTFKISEEQEKIFKECEKLKDALKKQEKEINEKNRELDSFKFEIKNFKLNNESLTKNLADLAVETSLNKTNKRKIEEESFNLRNQNESLRENIASYISQIEKLNENILRLKEDIRVLEKDLENKDKEIEKKNTRLDVSNQEALENKNEGNWILSQVSIETNDNLIVVIDKFTNALKSANEKVERLEKENFHLKDKINKASLAKKELLLSIEEFRRTNQNDVLKYEKIIQQHENNKKLNENEIKDLSQSLERSELQKKTYVEELQSLETLIFNEKQASLSLSKKFEELVFEKEKIESKSSLKDEEITKQCKKIEKLQEYKIKYKLLEQQLKTVNEENWKIQQNYENMNTKYSNEKQKKNKEESVLQEKILGLQEELNNEKNFNSIHLQEVIKLKRALSSKEGKIHRDQLIEEENKYKARIALLEMEIAENKEIIAKLQKNIAYSAVKIEEKGILINELQNLLDSRNKALNDPNFVQIQEKASFLKEREKSIENEMQKVFYALEAFENGMACIVCLSCLDNPVLIIPCCHSVCEKCLGLTRSVCPQCSQKMMGNYRIKWLDQLIDKIAFQRQVLDSIKAILSKNVFL